MFPLTRRPYFHLKDVLFKFAGGTVLFGPLSASLDNRICGLVGRNGSGKSVLLRILAGREHETSGYVGRYGQFAYIPQHTEVSSETTVAALLGLQEVFDARLRTEQGMADGDAIDLTRTAWDLTERLSVAFRDANLPVFSPHQAAIELSCGQRTRALLSAAFITEAEYLLLDEPTNHLDRDGREWFYRHLEKWRGGALIASHDRHLLKRVERIIELDNRTIISFGGNYDFFEQQKNTCRKAALADILHARKARRLSQAEVQQEHDSSLRRSAASLRKVAMLNLPSGAKTAYKSAAREHPARLKSRHAEKKQKYQHAVLAASERLSEDPDVFFTFTDSAVPALKTVLVLDRLVLPYSCLPALDCQITGPARVGVTGPNGCGKSTLIKVIAGLANSRSGACRVSVRTAYVDQDLMFATPSLSLLEHFSLQDTSMSEGELRSHLALLQIGAGRVILPFQDLSGGERLKGLLASALWCREPAQMLILDEPTNHLDLKSVKAVEAALAGFKGAMLVVSHDETFLNNLGLTHRLEWSTQGWHYRQVQ